MKKLLLPFIMLVTITNANEQNPVSYAAFYYPSKKIIISLNDDHTPEGCFARANAYKNMKDYTNAVKQYLYAAGSPSGPASSEIPGSYLMIANRSPYYEDSIFETAEICYDQSKYKTAIRLIDLISGKDPYLYFEAQLLKCNSLVFTGMPEKALQVMNETMQKSVSDSDKPTGYLRLAFIYGKLRKKSKSLEYYKKTIHEFPDSWESRTASLELYNLKKSYPLDAATCNAAAGILFKNKKYKETVSLLGDISGSKSSQIYFKSLLISGNSRLAEKFINDSDPPNRENSLLFKAEWLISKNPGESRSIYQTLSGSRNISIASEALYRIFIIEYLRSAETITNNTDNYISHYPATEHAEDLLWLRIKTQIGKDKQAALNDLRLIERDFKQSRNTDRLFFLMYTLEKDKMIKRDNLRKLLLLHPDSYYSIRAIFSINPKDIPFYTELSGKTPDNQDNLKIRHYFSTIRSYNEESYCKSIDTLVKDNSYENDFSKLQRRLKSADFINEYILFEKYFKAGYMRGINRISGNRTVKDFEKLRLTALSDLSQKYGNYYLLRYSTMRIMELLHYPENIMLLKPASVQRLLPPAFQTAVDKSSKLNKTDKSLMYAIMISESSFNHRFRSDASALGVMQLRQSTASDMAKLVKLREFSLFNPDDSALLASKYISKLCGRYKNNIHLTAASYNAGMGNVNNWLQKIDPSDTDIFVEQIPYQETISYLESVYKYYVLYQTYYGN